MNHYQYSEYSKQVYYRLIALWIVCEAFAGGIMHAAKIPFTGLIVSALAITCIILIAYYVPSKSAIIKATIIVAIFKLMLSPHSPPTAYIAVFFQGALGQLLLNNKRYSRIAAVLLAVLSLVESAIQRLLVLLVFSGTAFWKAVNEFIQKIAGDKKPTDYSFKLAIGYIIVHALAGIFVGLYAVRLAKASATWKNKYPNLVIAKQDHEQIIVPKNAARKRKLKWVSVIMLIVLASLYVQSAVDPSHTIIPSNIILNILLRSALILLCWYLIIGPIVMLLIKRSLQSKQQKYREEINGIILLLPHTRYIFRQAFRLSAERKGLSRIKLFLKILLINVLAD